MLTTWRDLEMSLSSFLACRILFYCICFKILLGQQAFPDEDVERAKDVFADIDMGVDMGSTDEEKREWYDPAQLAQFRGVFEPKLQVGAITAHAIVCQPIRRLRIPWFEVFESTTFQALVVRHVGTLVAG